MVRTEIREQILVRLKNAEAEHSMKVLYACESGSRAWGFASPDSDYDVRFIYVRDPEWYLSFDVERRRDVIEYPIVDDIDCCGWDLRKALYLFTRTNGALLEWLHSPIVYLDRWNVAEELRRVAPQVCNPIALCYHYSHLARNHLGAGDARDSLCRVQVRLKTYFYLLRALLAIRYITERGGVPPVPFVELVDAVAPSELRDSIAALLERKRGSPELGLGEPIEAIGSFINGELDRHRNMFSGQGRPELADAHGARDELNSLFRRVVQQAKSDST